MPQTFGVIDLFAGPGGLGEGISSIETDGHRPFRIVLSVEKEASAHATLRLRAFLRLVRWSTGRLPPAYIDFHAGRIPEPDWAALDPVAWAHADAEARQLELGGPEAAEAIDTAIKAVRRTHDDAILIGGPPCQAYSLVGRARSRGIVGYRPKDDARHFLFREYIRVLDRLRPAAFLMENVKGILSSTVDSRRIFEMLLRDLGALGTRGGRPYELFALDPSGGAGGLLATAEPRDFVIRAEDHGVPQRRHRVILLGLRQDIVQRLARGVLLPPEPRQATVAEVIGMLPTLRSGLSRGDDPDRWREVVLAAARRLRDPVRLRNAPGTADALAEIEVLLAAGEGPTRRAARDRPPMGAADAPEVLSWIERPELEALAQHETRGHMPSDLGRYLFAAIEGQATGRSPRAGDFPPSLVPDHRSWRTGDFNDRFRVQLAGQPSTTITSHIAKDGHYFIHPDPLASPRGPTRPCRPLARGSGDFQAAA